MLNDRHLALLDSGCSHLVRASARLPSRVLTLAGVRPCVVPLGVLPERATEETASA